MAKIHSRGYMPSNDPEIQEREGYEDDHFAKNGRLNFANKVRILSEPRMAGCQFSSAFCSYPYLPGDGPLSLETLFTLWNMNTGFIEECQKCQGKALITGFTGSPLSGCGAAWGYCIDCASYHRGAEKFRDYFRKWIQLYPKFRSKSTDDRYSLEEVIALLGENA